MEPTTPGGSGLSYPGTELETFAHAERWKAYWTGRVRRYVTGDVLEVGAGIGANTRLLWTAGVGSWHCLEPDADLAGQLRDNVADLEGCHVTVGTVDTAGGRQYDTIIYADVLEHIGDDRRELEKANALLRPGGHLVVLAPAHQCLYTPFDAALGHYRRYDRHSLRACAPPGAEMVALYYLDSVGMLASLANLVYLRQSRPTLRQILVWDRVMVPLSTVLDRLSFGTIGKSVLGVWRRRPMATGAASATS